VHGYWLCPLSLVVSESSKEAIRFIGRAAIVGIVIALLGLVAVADWPFPMLFSQGIAVTAGSFSFCMMIWNAKNG
jgi:uncharacterized membrane protein